MVLRPSGPTTGSVTIRVVGDHDQQSTLTVGGAAVAATIGRPGAVARLTFAGTAGQKVTVTIHDSTFPDSCGLVALLSPTGSTLDLMCVRNGSGTLPATLPATGTYTVLVNPDGQMTGSVTVNVA